MPAFRTAAVSTLSVIGLGEHKQPVLQVVILGAKPACGVGAIHALIFAKRTHGWAPLELQHVPYRD